jgi:hypothetical protein
MKMPINMGLAALLKRLAAPVSLKRSGTAPPSPADYLSP